MFTMKAQKKTSKDYGLYCFRVSNAERDELKDLLETAKKRLNRNKPDDEYTITKNQILLEAVRLGLPLVKRQK